MTKRSGKAAPKPATKAPVKQPAKKQEPVAQAPAPAAAAEQERVEAQAPAVDTSAQGSDTPPVDAQVQTDAAADPPKKPEQPLSVLFGSDRWPAEIEIGANKVALGDVVRVAFERVGVTLEVWNDSPEIREREIADEVERLRKADADAAAAAAAAERPVDFEFLSHADRNNPEKLHGTHLREFAHRQGLSWSEIGRCSDHKIREQLRYIAYRRYER